MRIWAIVPVKPLNRGKSRLATMLDIEQREAFNREMFERTLKTLKAVKEINGVLVVSRDTAALALARQYDVHTVQESGAPELNNALQRATNAVAAFNAHGVLIVASDIPFMEPEDIQGMIKMAKSAPSPHVMVIATDDEQNGSNVMFVSPPGAIPYCYGEGSYQKHKAQAEKAGLTIRNYESDRLALDIDTPEDLELYRSMLTEQELTHPVWLQKMETSTEAK